MMFDLVVNFKKELSEKIDEVTRSNGSIRHPYEDYVYNVGRVRGLSEALDMYSDYLRKIITEDDED